MNKNLIAVCLIALVIVTGSVVQADAPKVNPPSLASTQNAVNVWQKQRSDLIAEVLLIVEQGVAVPQKIAYTPEERELMKKAKDAMGLLGELQATEAIPLLASHLTFNVPSEIPFVTASVGIEDISPGSVVLAKFGLPALDPVLEQFISSPNVRLRYPTYFVVKEVLKSRPVIIAYIEEYRKRRNITDVQQDRLNKFLELFSGD